MKKKIRETTLYRDAAVRCAELKKVREELIQEINGLPAGEVHIMMNRGRAQYYIRESPKDVCGKYISKKDEKTIRQYVQKRYDKKIIGALDKEILLLEKFIQNSAKKSQNLSDYYTDIPREARKYVEPIAINDEEETAAWLNLPYRTKGIVGTEVTQTTDRGEIVRSKSELNIANLLYKNGIPYKYECPLRLRGGNVIHPDFTIWDAHRHREVYWEHRGMMDDRNYLRDTVGRVKDYMRNKIYLGEQLIITEELATQPLSTNEISAIINHYFTNNE